MADSQKLSLKLVIHKERNQVVFAESDKDFVDILFNFLTLPLGTIIRLLNKKNSSPFYGFPLGCLNTMYQSIENLDAETFETQASKAMLLQPRGAYERHFRYLKINVNDQNPREIYTCSNSDCHLKTFRLYSLVPGALCGCKKTMDVALVSDFIEENKNDCSFKGGSEDGVFFKGGSERFLITDDFHVMSARTAHYLTLLNKLGIRDGINLERREVEIGQEEILNLLERSLLTNTVLSDVFLGYNNPVLLHDMEVIKEKEPNKIETDINNDKASIELKLLVNKETDEILYAEANGEFINLLLSFLTFPLGSVVELLDKRFPLMCAENLYKSVAALVESDVDFLKSEECKTMLLRPKLAPYFGWSNQILNVEEKLPDKLTYPHIFVTINLVNPKLPHPGVKALNLLKAALISNNALSSAFSVKKRRSNRRHCSRDESC